MRSSFDRERVIGAVDAIKEDYEKFLYDICCIESPSDDKAATDAMADHVESFAVSRGFSVKRHRFDNCGDMLEITLNPEGKKKCFFLAHMDTVHEKGKFGYPPVKAEGGIMRGPGVIDCKGGIAIALCCMEALKKLGFTDQIKFFTNSDEEVNNRFGGERERELFRELSRGFEFAVSCEVSAEGSILTGRRGIVRRTVEVTGKSAHSGISYFDGISAVKEAAYKIIELENQSRKGGITYCCGVIKGGEKANIVPEKCVFTVDARAKDEAEMAEARRVIDGIVKRSFVEGTVSEYAADHFRPPMARTPENEALARRVSDIWVSLGGVRLESKISGGGSDAAYTVQAGVPTVCGIGGIGEFCHTKDEYLKLDSIALRAKTFALLCCGYGGKEEK